MDVHIYIYIYIYIYMYVCERACVFICGCFTVMTTLDIIELLSLHFMHLHNLHHHNVDVTVGNKGHCSFPL